VRPMALEIHRDFCEVAVKEEGEHRSAGRVKTTVAERELFARSLRADDQDGTRAAIAVILEPHVARVVVAKPGACAPSPRPS
jgi:hypothetical protein